MNKPDPKTRLSSLLDRLPSAQQAQLLEFAEFLFERHAIPEDVVTEPISIERPETETVIAAMKRLRDSYPMLDPEKLLHETSTLMSAHLMQGKPADEVIDALEKIFQDHYEVYRSH